MACNELTKPQRNKNTHNKTNNKHTKHPCSSVSWLSPMHPICFAWLRVGCGGSGGRPCVWPNPSVCSMSPEAERSGERVPAPRSYDRSRGGESEPTRRSERTHASDRRRAKPTHVHRAGNFTGIRAPSTTAAGSILPRCRPQPLLQGWLSKKLPGG